MLIFRDIKTLSEYPAFKKLDFTDLESFKDSSSIEKCLTEGDIIDAFNILIDNYPALGVFYMSDFLPNLVIPMLPIIFRMNMVDNYKKTANNIGKLLTGEGVDYDFNHAIDHVILSLVSAITNEDTFECFKLHLQKLNFNGLAEFASNFVRDGDSLEDALENMNNNFDQLLEQFAKSKSTDQENLEN